VGGYNWKKRNGKSREIKEWESRKRREGREGQNEKRKK